MRRFLQFGTICIALKRENKHGGVLFLIKVILLHGWLSYFLYCTNGTKSCKASRIHFSIKDHLLFYFNPDLIVTTQIKCPMSVSCPKNRHKTTHQNKSYVRCFIVFIKRKKKETIQSTTCYTLPIVYNVS